MLTEIRYLYCNTLFPVKMGIIKEMVSLYIFYVNPDSKYLIYLVFLNMEKN